MNDSSASAHTHGPLPLGAGPVNAAFREILSDGALGFIAALARKFTPRIEQALAARQERQQAIDNGEMPDFLESTREVRESDWRVCSVPADLEDRRVEITGPTDRKMIINALNSGAKVFMADCEDSLAPTWENIIQGQVNLRDAVRRTIELDAGGKHYALQEQTATLIVRPRGWHLLEKHITVDGKPVPGALVDFGLYLFHNAAELKKRGTGPYFYLPKLESHLEARIWNDVFRFAEEQGVIGKGEIKGKLAFEVDGASKSAVAAVEKQGGTVKVLRAPKTEADEKAAEKSGKEAGGEASA